jgi:DNA polymerase elongation subunit (family B)
MIAIIDGTYEIVNDLTYLVLIGRNKKGEKLIYREQTDPYFFIKEEQEKEISPESIMDTEKGYYDIFGNKTTKIFTYHPDQVGQLNNEYSHLDFYESHILFPLRKMIDKGIYHIVDDDWKPIKSEKGFDMWRKCYIDIECGSSSGVPNWKTPVEQIYMITIYEEKTNQIITWIFHPDIKKDFIQTTDFSMEKYVDINKLMTTKITREIKKLRNLELRFFRYERDMLTDFCHIMGMKSYDFIGSWNGSGGMWFNKNYDPGFDFPYIIGRCKELGVYYNSLSLINKVYQRRNGEVIIAGTQLFDVMYWKIHNDKKRKAVSLEASSQEELHFGKLKLPRKNNFLDLMRKHLNTAIAYNIIDVLNTYLVDDKLNLSGKFYSFFVKEAGVFLTDTNRNSRIWHIRLLRKLKEIDPKLCLPSKHYGRYNSSGKSRKGGRVFEPKAGIYTNKYIAILDFSQEYPYVAITFNSCPTTKISQKEAHKLGFKNYYKAPNGIYYKRDPEGIIPKLFREDTEKRKQLKRIRDFNGEKYGADSDEYKLADHTQYKYKTWVNSLFGVLGYSSFPLYDEDVFNTITAGGRFGILMAANICEEVLGYNVIYGDSDSVMVSLNADNLDDAKTEGKMLELYINDYFNKWIPKIFKTKNSYHIKMEEIDRAFIISERKKRYMKWVVWKDGMEVNIIPKIKGDESIKYNSSAFTKKLLKELYIKMLQGEDSSSIKKFLRKAAEEMRNEPLVDIGIPTSINKEWENYDTDQEKIMACIYSNDVFGTTFSGKCTPKLVYVKDMPVSAIAVTDIVTIDKKKIDWDKMEDRNIWNLVVDWIKLHPLNLTKLEVKYGIKKRKKGAGLSL